MKKLALIQGLGELPHGKIILLEFKGWQHFQLYSLTSKVTLGRSISQSIASSNEASPALWYQLQIPSSNLTFVGSAVSRCSLLPLRFQCLPTTFLLPGLGHLSLETSSAMPPSCSP